MSATNRAKTRDVEAAAVRQIKKPLPALDLESVELIQEIQPGVEKKPRGRPRSKSDPNDPTPHEKRMAELRIRSQEPFVKMLGALLDAEPTPAALRAWAKRAPDKWVAAVVNVARICGYMEKQQGGGITLDYMTGLSDAQLIQMATQMARGVPIGETLNSAVAPKAENRPVPTKVVDVGPDNA